ncbi:hypothetical protein LTR86_010430 [Recurvomyces mirabilis]|nr:hypothetical protein LTR86_010430 [Recurvomyces mirabilis]
MAAVQDPWKLYNTSVTVRPGQTRLLRLHQNPEDGPLEADLVVVSIGPGGAYLSKTEEHVEYTALSYTWGNGPFAHHITINGVAWRIKEGLHDFLHQYRSSTQALGGQRDRYLWVDALVINQADASEKSHQVASMIEVYDKASHVQVWLGKETKHTATAVSFLQHLLTDTQRKNKIISTDALDGLRDLYNRPWPTRMWIRQEVWAAKTISIQCGSLLMPLEVFKAGMVGSREAGDTLDGDDGSERVTGHQASEDRAVSGLGHKAMESNGRKDILWLLYESVNYESTDVRDRIYALIGMCDDSEIEIDYHKSPSEVFTSLARHLMLRARSLGLVLDQSCKYGRQSDLDLPSWVPDWRTLELVRYEPQYGRRCDMSGSITHDQPHVLILYGFQLGKAKVAKAKKKRKNEEHLNKLLVPLDWPRISDRLKDSGLHPEFLTRAPRDQIVELDFTSGDSRPGDCLVAVCGSDNLLLLRRLPDREGAEYEFITCIHSDARRKLRESLLDYGAENNVLETFVTV